jgi:hypothetical protein
MKEEKNKKKNENETRCRCCEGKGYYWIDTTMLYCWCPTGLQMAQTDYEQFEQLKERDRRAKSYWQE